jgi:hypothetical protein
MVVMVELDTLETRLTPAMQAMATMVAMQVHQLAYQPLGRVQQQRLQVLALAVQAAAVPITAAAVAAVEAVVQPQQHKSVHAHHQQLVQVTSGKAAQAAQVDSLRASQH